MPLNHPSAIEHVCLHDAVKPKPKLDPTGTGDIRRRFRGAADIRWRRFITMLKSAVMTQDMLGLSATERPGAFAILSASLPTDGKLRVFQGWVDATLKRFVIEEDAAYLDGIASTAYRRAVARAMRRSFSPAQPVNATEQIAALQQLTLMELQGVVEAVSQQLVRTATDAVLGKWSHRDTFNDMKEIVEKIGVNRTRLLVEVLTIKAHSTGTLDQFQAAGVKRVGTIPELDPDKVKARLRLGDAQRPISPAQRRKGTSSSTIARIRKEEARVEKSLAAQQVEVLTAGDADVCPECEEIAADGPYDIDEARSLIPAHPNCRCEFVPEGSSLFGTIEEE